ncbi:MAG: NACHT domain-containing protein [Thermodesulfobacteriota bacterium]
MKRTPIPAWLFAPPVQLDRPPVIKREQGLPFDQLTWPDFERLVLRVVAADREVLDCRVYGVPGQAQHGIDLLATRVASPGEQACFQCKKVKGFRVADVHAAIKKFEEGPWTTRTREFTLCVASSLESTDLTDAIVKERARLAASNIVLRVWDGSPSGELNVLLKDLPQIVDDFFGREWVRAFNGQAAANNLGERLDGIDFAALRERLSELYRVIFSQHDPGLRPCQSEPNDYSRRYVRADILESAVVEQGSLVGAGRRESVESRAQPTSDRMEHEPQQTSAPAVSTYSVRRPTWEWLRDKENCIVLGEPGHGKSVLLRQLAIVLNTKDFVEEMPFGTSHARRLPVWISFARFAAAIAKDSSISVEDFFCSWLHQYGYGDTQHLFRKALRDSAFVLLVDGLDEGAEAKEGCEALDRVITFSRSHRAIVVCTSRPRSFASLPVPLMWPSATLAPLDDGQIEELATRWFAIAEGASTDESDETRLARAKPRGEGFCNAIKASARTHELARNPLLCQALIELYRLSHRLPEARIRAYGEIIDLFLRRHPQARAHAGFATPPAALEDLRDADLQDILIKIASDTQSTETGDIALRERCVELCAQYLEDDLMGLGLPRPRAVRRAPEIIELLINHFGILIERSPGELSFVHLSLQEFLAAKAVAAMPEPEQLTWVRTVALQQKWRECLICWFAIQGEIGHRTLAVYASRILEEIGRRGEWERLQTLSLRTVLATADLGLPVGEARNVIAEAIQEVDTSPFPDFRSKLARSITVGALGGSIKEECAAAIVRWTPARSYFDRAQMLRAFGGWSASTDLEETLRRALRDERVECRRAAAESYAEAFAANPMAPPYLLSVAKSNARPEVRAAALHALTQISAWSDFASEAAEWNIGSHAPELQLSCIATRVRSQLHTKDDLARLLTILSADSLDYALREQLTRLICDGWPRDTALRSRCLRFIRQEHGTADLPFPLEYLVSGYQNDSEIAGAIAGLLGCYGIHMVINPGRFWELLRAGYAGHQIVVQATRSALAEYQEKFAAIMWHPHTVPAYLVLADDQARDELIAGYRDADLQGRYWIVSTLFQGWSQDSVVQKQIQRWANESVALAAPLAEYAKYVKPLEAERLIWLERLVSEADDRIVSRPIYALLEERPDERTHSLVSERLKDPGIWYYHRINLEATLAAAYPECEQSRHTVERAFTEADGPSLGVLAAAYQNDPAIRPRLLTAAAPAPVDVRLSIASFLRERGGSPDLIERLTPGVLTEETGAVRAAALMARARACRHDASRAPSLIELLSVEATAIGVVMNRRRRTAVAALLEMGEADRVAQILADDKHSLPHRWIDLLERDFVSLGALLDHWTDLQAAATTRGLSIKLPVAELLNAGYGPFLERASTVRSQIEESLDAKGKEWHAGQQIEILSRLHPRSAELRSTLCKTLDGRASTLPSGRHACLAVRLLGEHFGGDVGVLADVIPVGQLPDLASGSPGVLGHLVRSWPQIDLAIAARGSGLEDRKRWSALDRLICTTVWGYWDEASTAAREVISQRYRHGYVEPEDAEALRIWARSDGSLNTLGRWRESSDGDEATAALMLLGDRASIPREDADWLRSAFNRGIADKTKAPLDGYDLAAGHVVPWLQKAYELLSRSG